MNEVRKKKWASALASGDFYFIETYSGYRRSSADPKGKNYTLAPDAGTEALGVALLDALAHSRFLSLEELDEFFDYKKAQQHYESWVEAFIKHHGYKSRKALFKNMACCNIVVRPDEGVMEIVPMRHGQLEGWSREKDVGSKTFTFLPIVRQRRLARLFEWRSVGAHDLRRTQVIAGTYRGTVLTHFVDPSIGLNVIRDSSGNLLSGWKLGPDQLQNVLTRGRL